MTLWAGYVKKQFPNGTKTTYAYDRKDQLTEFDVKI
jgi:hypothetical protein